MTTQLPGMSAFALRDGAVYHTYSTYARGLDALWGMYPGSTALPWAATSRVAGIAVTTSTRCAERHDRY